MSNRLIVVLASLGLVMVVGLVAGGCRGGKFPGTGCSGGACSAPTNPPSTYSSSTYESSATIVQEPTAGTYAPAPMPQGSGSR